MEKKSLVLRVNLVPVRHFRILRAMVHAHLAFFVPPVQIKTMKTDVVGNKPIQQRFIAPLEVQPVPLSVVVNILFVVPYKTQIVHKIKELHAWKINAITKMIVLLDSLVKMVNL